MKIESLTPQDIEVLSNDIRVMQTAKKVLRVVSPVLLIATLACWYFTVSGMITFICTGLCLFAFVAWTGSFLHVRRISQDLALNTKITSRYILTRKMIEGISTGKDKRMTEIMLTDETIQDLIDYKSTRGPASFSRHEHRDAMLRYTYRFHVTDFDSRQIEEQFIVPIEYFLVGTPQGQITISHAANSRKVLQVIGQ